MTPPRWPVAPRVMKYSFRNWLLRLVSAVVGMVALLVVAELTFWLLPVREATPAFLPVGDDRIARFEPNERWRY